MKRLIEWLFASPPTPTEPMVPQRHYEEIKAHAIKATRQALEMEMERDAYRNALRDRNDDLSRIMKQRDEAKQDAQRARAAAEKSGRAQADNEVAIRDLKAELVRSHTDHAADEADHERAERERDEAVDARDRMLKDRNDAWEARDRAEQIIYDVLEIPEVSEVPCSPDQSIVPEVIEALRRLTVKVTTLQQEARKAMRSISAQNTGCEEAWKLLNDVLNATGFKEGA